MEFFCANPRNLWEIFLIPLISQITAELISGVFCANPRNLRKKEFYRIPLISQITAEKIIQSLLRKSASICGRKEVFCENSVS
jgi:hypothetical protein